MDMGLCEGDCRTRTDLYIIGYVEQWRILSVVPFLKNEDILQENYFFGGEQNKNVGRCQI